MRDVGTYWGKCREGSILRRRIACNSLAGHHGKSPLDYPQLKKVQNATRDLFDKVASEIHGFKGHPYLLEEVVILAPEPAPKSSRKSKQKAKGAFGIPPLPSQLAEPAELQAEKVELGYTRSADPRSWRKAEQALRRRSENEATLNLIRLRAL